MSLPAVLQVPLAYTEAARGLCVTSANSTSKKKRSHQSNNSIIANLSVTKYRYWELLHFESEIKNKVRGIHNNKLTTVALFMVTLGTLK